MIEHVLVVATIAVLGVSALLVTIRIVRGPSVLDRAVATEVLISILVCALALETASTRHSGTLPILISLSLVGFVGSVSVARFVARDRDEAAPVPHPGAPDRPAGQGGRAATDGRVP